MTRLALLRHGHTAWNRAGRIQGRTDIPLDAQAEAMLATLALPQAWDRAALVTSPLSRAHATAALVAGREPKTVSALTEMDWGAWEGLRGAELRTDPTSGFLDIEAWGWDFRPPDGESPADVRDRLLPWLVSIDDDTVAVCHIGVMRVIMAMASGWAFRGPCPFVIKRNRLYILTRAGSHWELDPRPQRLKPRDR